MRFENKTVIVTGSTKGIGAQMARRFAQEGAQVTVTGRSRVPGEAIVSEIRDAGGVAEFVAGDISRSADVHAVVQATAERFGGVDVLINNAAPIDMLATADKPVVDLDEEGFDRIMRIGLYGAVFATQAVIPWMLKRGGGAIVSISSIAGLQGVRGTPGYTCAKGALQAFARQVATDYGRAGVRSNCIISGAIASSGLVGAALEENKEWADALMRASLAKDGRLGTPDDIAEAAMYLASDAASAINGAFLPVDQGFTCLSHASMDISIVMAGDAAQAAAAGWQEQISG
jgi:NAD(P)-dependent dehydrogenase (short-subunit alcohol dehydrogenase family)